MIAFNDFLGIPVTFYKDLNPPWGYTFYEIRKVKECNKCKALSYKRKKALT
jgi:hypothetical protein